MYWKTKKGQSLIEVVFAIGLLSLVLTGVVGLLINSLRARTRGFDRKKASDVGQKVVEELIQKKYEDPVTFWDPFSTYWSNNVGTTHTMVEFPGYTYSIGATQIINVGSSCRPSQFECFEARITVNWNGSTTGEKVSFTRFFSKK